MTNQLKNVFTRKQQAAAAGLASLVAAGSSQAAIDVTSVITPLADGLIAVGTIGGAILAVWGIKKVYSMIAPK